MAPYQYKPVWHYLRCASQGPDGEAEEELDPEFFSSSENLDVDGAGLGVGAVSGVVAYFFISSDKLEDEDGADNPSNPCFFAT